MHSRVRAALLASAALMVIAPASGAAALSHAAAGQQLTWTIVRSPDKPVNTTIFTGVSCPSASACTAVGYAARSDAQSKPFIASWNGTAWSAVPSPSRHSRDYLSGVSCTSASACTTVGWSEKRRGEGKTLVESWNGTTWSIVPSPDQLEFTQNLLLGVSCLSASACTAVGAYQPSPSVVATLIESWNGTTWSIVPSPSPDRFRDYLYSVSCVSATACTAVGGSSKGTLAETWNGTAWSVVPSPDKGASSDNTLKSVSCVAAGACTAVGSYAGSAKSPTRTLIESWNGTAWSVVPSPNAGRAANSNELSGVSCTAADACTAAGSYKPTKLRPARTLVESWNGTAWSIVHSRNIGGPQFSDYLSGVSCASTATCVAGGWTDHRSRRDRTLTELGTSSG